MGEPKTHGIPSNIEKMLDEASADFLQELESVLPFGADAASSFPDSARILDFPQYAKGATAREIEDAREAGFWELKSAITGELPNLPPDFAMRLPTEALDDGALEEVSDSPENDIGFDISFRGYNRQQVETYVDALTKDYNKICARCRELEEKNKMLREGSDAIGAAILRAENLARKVVEDAENEARRIRQKALSQQQPPFGFPRMRSL